MFYDAFLNIFKHIKFYTYEKQTGDFLMILMVAIFSLVEKKRMKIGCKEKIEIVIAGNMLIL